MTFYDFLEEMYMDRPKSILFAYYEGENRIDVTVEQWIRDVFDFAAYLTAKNGEEKQNIGISGKHSYMWYVVVFAAVISGNTAVSVNMGLSAEELLYELKKADVSVLYTASEEEEFENFLEDAGIYWKKGEKAMEESRGCACGRIFFGDQAEDNTKTALILFSSGTGGTPKGVMLSQKNILFSSKIYKTTDIFKDDRMLLLLPLYHVGGIYFSITLMKCHVTFCICESPKYIVRDMKRYCPTVMAMVPAQLAFILERCGKDKKLKEIVSESLNYIVCVGAALEDRYEDDAGSFGVQLLNLYGLTETAGSLTRWFPHKKGSIGLFSEINEMKIFDGELLIRGNSVTDGYYKDPDKTAELFEDGWMHTGDLVRMDDEGFLYIVGRKKNIIIFANGENISPEELENRIMRIPEVEEVIVTGRNQILEAIVFLGEKDSELNRNAVEQAIGNMNSSVPRFQQIRKVIFRDSPFPKTGSGKIRRNL